MAVSPIDVRAIYTTALSDAEIQTFIDTASLIVTEGLAAKTSCVMSEARRDKLITYLAAHFLYMTENSSGATPGALRRSKLGEADESYATPATGMYGYMSSSFGQIATNLDICGILAGQNANMGLKAEFRVI